VGASITQGSTLYTKEIRVLSNDSLSTHEQALLIDAHPSIREQVLSVSRLVLSREST
jgi:hypothetical protein